MVKSDLEVRKRILDEARSLFFRYGFSKVTMDETAAGLGMSKKTLYQHFQSKEDLLQAVTTDHMEAMDEELHDMCARKDWNPLDKLKRLMNYVAGIYSKMSDALVHDLRRSAPGIWKRVKSAHLLAGWAYAATAVKTKTNNFISTPIPGTTSGHALVASDQPRYSRTLDPKAHNKDLSWQSS